MSSKYEPWSSGCGGFGSVVGEVEVLELGCGEEAEAEIVGPLELTAQHVAGVALERACRRGWRCRRRPGRPSSRSPVRKGRIWKVFGSGQAMTSLSCTRLKPSIAEPSKVIPSSSAFSSSAGVMREGLRDAEDVGEPELDEADAALLHGLAARTPAGSASPAPLQPARCRRDRPATHKCRRSGEGRPTGARRADPGRYDPGRYDAPRGPPADCALPARRGRRRPRGQRRARARGARAGRG